MIIRTVRPVTQAECNKKQIKERQNCLLHDHANSSFGPTSGILSKIKQIIERQNCLLNDYASRSPGQIKNITALLKYMYTPQVFRKK